MPIIKAFAEGKIIQYKYDTGWENIKNPAFNGLPTEYRIKLKPKYRLFKNQEECWKEMLKHQPFGWIKNKNGYWFISSIHKFIEETKTFECYTFADGTSFGIKEE